MRRTFLKLQGLLKAYVQNDDMVSKNDKSCHICSMKQKGVFLAKYETDSVCISLIFHENIVENSEE